MVCQNIGAMLAHVSPRSEAVGIMAQDYLCNMELKAIKETRTQFALAIHAVSPELLQAMANLSPQQVDSILETVWRSIRGSMHRQSELEGEIPF